MSKIRNRLSKIFSSTSSPQSNAVAPATATATATAAIPAAASPAPEAAVTAAQEKAVHAHSPSYHPSSRSLMPEKPTLRQQYPHIEPYKTGTLKLPPTTENGIVHEIYYELSGKEDGYPVVFLHGGPGGGFQKTDRRWFDPKHYRVLTFDQRGSGKSIPAAELEGNTTWDLVEDIERLRTEVMKVDKWHVFGGSWGSTLSLAYAQTHPERVSALILRGIFTLRRSELLFFYQEGSSFLWPELFQPFLDHIPLEERDDMIAAYYKRLTSEDPQVRLEAAKRWSTWENSTSKLYLDEEHLKRGDNDLWALQFARIEAHFFHNRGWMRDGQLLEKEQLAKIAHIPTVVVQGRYDVVCPAKTAWDLRTAWLSIDGAKDNFEFFLIPDAGHSAKEPGIADRLLYAADKFRSIK